MLQKTESLTVRTFRSKLAKATAHTDRERLRLDRLRKELVDVPAFTDMVNRCNQKVKEAVFAALPSLVTEILALEKMTEHSIANLVSRRLLAAVNRLAELSKPPSPLRS